MNCRAHLAAQYVRMSTDKQDLSIDLQKQAIAAYAQATGLQITATYEDAGKSGMTIRQREGMQGLVRDVTDPACPFTTVLVYDVSRWGRFQNTDASAYWEYHCQIHGVQVVYVAESFEQHTGPLGAVIKNLKRAMAAEYSRELAIKVRAGQERVIDLGYSAGGQPAIGLVRQAVSREGEPRMILRPGERKAVQSDRIKLVPGPPEEVALLRRIFELYANRPLGIADLLRLLQAERQLTAKGRPFTRRALETLLQYEPFIGHYVWGRRVQTEAGVRARPPQDHVRREGVIEPLISQELWERVQRKRLARGRPQRDSQQLLNDLKAALAKKPDLTGSDLASMGCAPAQTYFKAFGSLESAYALAGRTSAATSERWSRARTEASKSRTREIQADFAKALQAHGLPATTNFQSHVVTTATGVRIQVYLAWQRSFTKEPAWYVIRQRRAYSDCRLIVLMDEQRQPCGLYLVPQMQRFEFPILLYPDTLDRVSHHLIKNFAQAADVIQATNERRPTPGPTPNR